MQEKYRRWLKIITLLAGLFLLSKVISIMLPVVLAIILSFILHPIVNFIAKIPIGPAKYHLPRSISIFVSFLLIITFFGVVLSFILLPLLNEFNKFLVNLPDLLRRIETMATLINERTSSIDLPPSIRAFLDQLFSSAAAFSLNFMRRVANSVVGFTSQIVELVVVPVLTYYFLKDWKALKDGVIKIFNPAMQPKVSNIINEMGFVVSAYIRGQIMISIIVGISVTIGLYVLQVDYPFVLGLLAMLTETIPIVGPIVGAIPAIFISYLASPISAINVIIFYILIHQMENSILLPKVMGNTVAVHPVVIILSLLIGGQLLGIVGMMLAVPIAAILKVILHHLWFDDHL